MLFSKIKSYQEIKNLYQKHPWILLIPLAGVCFFTLNFSPEVSTGSPLPKVSEPNIDTLIPKGHLLIPIQIKNMSTLQNLMGRFATVNLYQQPSQQKTSSKKQHLVARHVRLIRSPRNPNLFAVLILEGQAQHILRYETPFIVALQSPSSDGTKFVTNSKKRRKIIIGN